MEWLALQPPNGDPPKLLAGYRQELIRQGASPDEASRRAAAVTALLPRAGWIAAGLYGFAGLAAVAWVNWYFFFAGRSAMPQAAAEPGREER